MDQQNFMPQEFGVILDKKKKDEALRRKRKSFTMPDNDDGSTIVTSGGAYYGTYLELDVIAKNESDLISKYRQTSMHPDVDTAVQEIVNDAIITQEEVDPVEIDTSKLEYSDKIKNSITDEFNHIMKLLDMKNRATDIFYRWYVDGRIYYEKIFDENTITGIQELRYIDPRKIKKVKNVVREKDTNGLDIVKKTDIFYLYNEQGINFSVNYNPKNISSGVKISPENIAFAPSGLMDMDSNIVISHLHKAIKPTNQLKMLADSLVIYRLCLIGDTRVKTTNGWKYIKDINTNDVIYSFYGKEGIKETKVVKQWKTGTKQTYRISSRHFEIVGTDNHPILVLDKTTNEVGYVDIANIIPKRHCFVYAKPLDSDNKIAIPSPRNIAVKITNSDVFSSLKIQNKESYISNIASDNNWKHSSIRNFLYGQQFLEKEIAIELLTKIGIYDDVILEEKYEGFCTNQNINLPEYVDEEFARLFGFLIGDGSIDNNRIIFAEGEHEDINSYYSTILQKYFGNCVKYDCDGRTYSNYTTRSTLGSEIFYKMGYISGAKNKRIPKWVFMASNSIKKAFILGLSDADGCEKDSVYTGSWSSEIELSNKQLIEDIKEIWTSIGLSSGKIRYRYREGGRCISEERNPLPDSHSWTLYISDMPLQQFETIYKKEYADIEDVYEIEVESVKHNFIANGVVVHNSRAPERRIFYIDVGNLPQKKAEEYMKDLMNRYKNKIVYDSATGEIRDSRKFMTMLEDFWLPRKDGKGTEISTLPGGDHLDQIADIEYFQNKLYQALNVPTSRFNQESQINFGRVAEINREELKFAKFVDRLRRKFSVLFDDLLRTQLIAKRIIAPDEWDDIKDKITYVFAQDQYYEESKEGELLRNRLDLLNQVNSYIGTYFSKNYVRKKILRMSDEEIKEIDDDNRNDPTLGQEDDGMGQAETGPSAIQAAELSKQVD